MHEYIISGHPLRSYSERLGVLSSSLKPESVKCASKLSGRTNFS